MKEINLKKTPIHEGSYQAAFMYKELLINTWSPASDMLPFKFGDDTLGVVAALGSFAVTFIFRKALRIRPYARVTCYFPVFGVSAVSTYMMNSVIISSDIVKEKSCPLCIWTKANMGQLLTGVVYPLLATPTVCFYTADRLLTYPIPPLVKAPKELFALYFKIVSKSFRPFLIIGAVNIIACSIITYLKQGAYLKIRNQSRMQNQALPK